MTLVAPAIATSALAACLGTPGAELALIANGTAESIGGLGPNATPGYAVDALSGEVFAPGAAWPPGRPMFASIRIALPDLANGPDHVFDLLTKLSGTGWRMQFLPPLAPMLDRSLAVLRARPQDLRRPTPTTPDRPVDGSGVVLGVVDFGCDFAHPAFLDDQGQTRLLFLWDQNAATPATPSVPGAVREQAEITAALASPDPYQALGYWPHRNCYAPAVARATDLVHGTHVLGVAAGRSMPDCPAGVAPGATLAFVHLRPGALVSSGDPADVFDGVCAIFHRAVTLGMPAVVNLSLGANWGSHDGNTLYDAAMDALLTRPGRAITVSAGNERQAGLNMDATVVAGAPTRLGWTFEAGDATPNTLRIFADAPDGSRPLACTIRIGDATITRALPESCNAQRFEAPNGLTGVLYSGLAPDGDGKAVQHIEILVRPSGQAERLDVMLSTTTGAAVPFDAWIDRDDRQTASQSRFDVTPPITRATLTCTACGRLTIAVGAFEHRDIAMPPAAFSAEGPTRDFRRKPDVAAPGLDVLAAAAYGGRVPPNGTWRNGFSMRMSGSSAAAPHAAGVLALMLELVPNLSAERSGQILRDTAHLEADDPATTWHPQLGHGRIDAAAAIDRATQ